MPHKWDTYLNVHYFFTFIPLFRRVCFLNTTTGHKHLHTKLTTAVQACMFLILIMPNRSTTSTGLVSYSGSVTPGNQATVRLNTDRKKYMCRILSFPSIWNLVKVSFLKDTWLAPRNFIINLCECKRVYIYIHTHSRGLTSNNTKYQGTTSSSKLASICAYKIPLKFRPFQLPG